MEDNDSVHNGSLSVITDASTKVSSFNSSNKFMGNFSWNYLNRRKMIEILWVEKTARIHHFFRETLFLKMIRLQGSGPAHQPEFEASSLSPGGYL